MRLLPHLAFMIAAAAASACGGEAKPAQDSAPTPEQPMSLPEPRVPIVAACPAGVTENPRCPLTDEQRIALRSQVGVELQRIERDFVNAWATEPTLLWRTFWFAFRTRLDLAIRGVFPPPGTTVPQAYGLVTEDVFRRLPALDDHSLQGMHASAKATTREQMVRSIVDYRGASKPQPPSRAPR